MEEVASPQAIVIRDEIQQLKKTERSRRASRSCAEAMRPTGRSWKSVKQNKGGSGGVASCRRQRHGNELLRNGLVR